MHPMLQRLDDLGAHLASRGDALALLGLGSAGVEHERMDEHSDLDFFVVVEDGAKERYLASIDWLEAVAPVAYSHVNDPNGRKALFADGIFVEYAVFTVGELPAIPYAGGRLVWRREDAPDGLEAMGRGPDCPAYDSVRFHVDEALTNLYVGLHRELRGEGLTATRFVQSYAVDHVLALLRLTTPPAAGSRDAFDGTRRVEQAWPPEALPLAEMVPGYGRNREAATVILGWLEQRYAVHPAIASAVRALLA